MKAGEHRNDLLSGAPTIALSRSVPLADRDSTARCSSLATDIPIPPVMTRAFRRECEKVPDFVGLTLEALNTLCIINTSGSAPRGRSEPQSCS